MALVPIKLVPVQFYGDTLDALSLDGEVYVSVRRCCESLGLNLATQLRKLKSSTWACVVKMTTHDNSGRRQELELIPCKKLPLWLVTIQAGKVRHEVREKLARYQNEAADVLAAHFLNTTKPEPRRPLLAYSVRCGEAGVVERSLPPDHWCVFVDAAKVLILAEKVLIPAGLEIKVVDLLDGSVGAHWRRFREGQPWTRPSLRYSYTFPAMGCNRDGLTVAPHCYHDDELIRFRRWLNGVYTPTIFPGYVLNKYKPDGYRKALPHIRREIPAALLA